MKDFKQKMKAFVGGRNFASGLLVALVIAVVVFVNVIAYTVTQYFQLYFYVQESDDLSVSDATEVLFDEAIREGKTVSVTFCMDKSELQTHQTGKFVYETALGFKEKYPEFIKLNYVNVYTKLYSDSDEHSSGELFDSSVYESYTDPETGKVSEYSFLGTSVIFEYKAYDGAGNLLKHNYRVVTDSYTTSGFADFFTTDGELNMTSYNGEEVFASMCAWVLKDSHSTAYVTVGHGETVDTSLVSALYCAGYYVDTLNLKTDPFPDDAGLIVISNPKHDFESSTNPALSTEIKKLEDYKNAGGKFYIVIDPLAKKLQAIERFVESFGIAMAKDSETGERYIVRDTENAITTDGYTLVAEHADNAMSNTMYSNFKDFGGSVVVRYSGALELTGEAKALLVSSPSSDCYAGGERVDGEGKYALAAYSTVDTQSGNEATIFFAPSVYMTSADAMVSDGYSNKNFLYSVFGEVYGEGEMPYGCNSVTLDNTVLENLRMGTARLYTALLLAIPAVLGIAGAVVIIRRKNR